MTIRVVDDSDPPSPVSNAQVVGRSLESGRYSRLEGTTDADGVVQVERELTELILLAVTIDKRLAGTARIDADAKAQTIRVTGACRVTGRLLDFLGEPVVGAKISLRFSTEIGQRNRQVLPSQDAITGTDGKFEFQGVCAGESCRVSVKTSETRSKVVSRFHADERNIDLGDLSLTENEYDLPTVTLP